MSKLQIGENFSLPEDAVTQTFAILGIRGSGKTNTAVVMFEEMVKQDDQCVVLDPTDAWYGVRSSHDGKSEGLKVYVFGGEHGDLPLEGTHGAQMADFVIDSGASVVFSLRHMTMADQRRFAADFAERLRFLKAKPENRNPIQIFLDEAEEFVPQNIRESDPNAARMFGAFNRMVRRDRNIGLGLTLISQRPQSVNKEPLSQVETLICHRLLHKLDRKSVKESWVEGHDTAGIGEKFLESLASLERGDVWVWSPYWLDVFKRVHVRHRETFDSSATPKAGQRAKTVKVRAPVDLELLRKQLSETIDKAKANDPTYLKRRILELERAAKQQPAAVATSSGDLDKAYEAGRRDLLAHLKNAKTQLERDAAKFTAASASLKFQDIPAFFAQVFARMNEIAAGLPVDTSMAAAQPRAMAAAAPRPSMPPRALVSHAGNGNGDLTNPERKILNALAWFDSIGLSQPKIAAVAFIAGYTVGGGAFNNPRGALRTKGLIEYRGDCLALTQDGRDKAEAPTTPLSTPEMHQRVLGILPTPEQKLLRPLLEAHPDALPYQELAQLSGYAEGGGAFNNPRGRLKTLELVTYPEKGMVRASDWLFID